MAFPAPYLIRFGCALSLVCAPAILQANQDIAPTKESLTSAKPGSFDSN